MQDKAHREDTQLLYLVDDAGMAEIFVELKEQLTEPLPTLVTLMYCSEQGEIFKKELEILEARFATKFFLVYQARRFSIHWTVEQENLEAIINANTLPGISVVISGEDMFVERAKELLYFLGVQDVSVHSIARS